MKYADIYKTISGFKIYFSDYKGFLDLSNELQLKGAKGVLSYMNYTFRGWGTGIAIPVESKVLAKSELKRKIMSEIVMFPVACPYTESGSHDIIMKYQGWRLDDGRWLEYRVPECRACGFRFYQIDLKKRGEEGH